MKKDLVAAIDVGSHAIRMKIGELSPGGGFKELEKVRKIAVLGHDTFTTDKIGFDTVDKVCEILGDFKWMMDAYGVKHYKALATSALREATNRDYLIDQIELKTGIEVKVIDNAQEQYLTLKAIKAHMDDFEEVVAEGAIVLVIGAGSIQVTTYQKGALTSTQNVKLGALRIKEGLGTLMHATTHYHDIVKEYIGVNLADLEVFKDGYTYSHLVIVGGEMSIIGDLVSDMNESKTSLKKKKLRHLYQELLSMSIDEIRVKYKIKQERAEIVIPSLMLLEPFMDRTDHKEIKLPRVSLTDGIVRLLYEELHHLKTDEETIKEMISSARSLARHFGNDHVHSAYVEDIAVKLFNKLKRYHGLQDERVHLRLAAILHDIGKFVSLDAHSDQSYKLIRSMELFGMSEMDVEMIATISKYHSTKAPSNYDRAFMNLPEAIRVTTAKLIAILRLADAMDRGHQQKIEIVSIKVKDKDLIIRGKSHQDTTLEQWSFDKKSPFFQEVYGMTPILKVTKGVE